MTDREFEELSDEEIMNMGGGSYDPNAMKPVEEDPVVDPDPVEESQPAEVVASENAEGVEDDDTDGGEEEEEDPSDEDLGDQPKTKTTEDPAGKDEEESADPAPKEGDGDPSTPGSDESKTEAEPKAETVDYEAGYKMMMGSFKANGKEFTPGSPEEAIKLMQMGANYTQKMQKLAPNLKLMRMLENKDLLAEDKLTFLIDLQERNPAAISKLLKDAKIDPLDLDTSDAAPTYQPGDHRVTDAEMAFTNSLDAVRATDTGLDTIKHINDAWDQTSKDALVREPRVLELINTQRANGLYDTIAREIERRRIMGDLTNVPFIQAYQDVGNELHAANKLVPAGAPAQEPVAPAPAVQDNSVQTQQNPPLETRTARRQSAKNDDKVRATAAPRSSTKSSASSFDPYTMTDEEIMAMQNIKV